MLCDDNASCNSTLNARNVLCNGGVPCDSVFREAVRQRHVQAAPQ